VSLGFFLSWEGIWQLKRRCLHRCACRPHDYNFPLHFFLRSSNGLRLGPDNHSSWRRSVKYNCVVQPALEFETAIAALRRSTKFRSWRHSLDPVGFSPADPKLAAMELHFSPADLAKKWGVSIETIRTIFREEPGVLKIGKPGTKFRRGYFTLRIPESIAERVHRRLSEGPA
jgi:hypothetical protein